jgi:hypothetical protein
MVENFFNSMCSLLNEIENKNRFLEAEGIELMVIMLKYVYRLHVLLSKLISVG